MNAIPKVPGGYQIVYLDPPWLYRDKANAGKRGAEHKYPCMPTEAIGRLLQTPDLFAPDCAMFLWVTPPMLPEAFELLHWTDFKFKTIAFWWGKRNKIANTPFFGMGNWTRANGEPCLLAVRGNPKRVSRSVGQFVWAKKRRHSEKPEIIRDLIVQLMGDVPRIELFSRHEVAGWARYGNEVLA